MKQFHDSMKDGLEAPASKALAPEVVIVQDCIYGAEQIILGNEVANAWRRKKKIVQIVIFILYCNFVIVMSTCRQTYYRKCFRALCGKCGNFQQLRTTNVLTASALVMQIASVPGITLHIRSSVEW